MPVCKSPGDPRPEMPSPDVIRPMDALVMLIDRWIDAQPEPKPSRPEALRHVLRDEMVKQGMLELYRASASP